ncbi:MAG: hypothetical protein ISS50_09420 [Anaerolineae bacterium]|nr:hypothetical protein [Anaerolineae bacterium]
MSFLKKIASALSPKGAEEGNALWVYVRCDKCSEAIKTRIDLRHDLTPNYSAEGRVTDYVVRKVLTGSQRCFEPIEVKLTFDPQRRVVSREITGGQFISEEEYEGDKQRGNEARGTR